MSDLPPDVEKLIGEVQYEEAGEFPVERGYIYTTCSSVENGNPLFWDDAVAEEITAGPIAPPTMISVWFRPHQWSPGRTEPAVPLQVHFDMKRIFELPEAVMTDNTIIFHEPVRPGDHWCGRNHTEIIVGGAIGPAVTASATASSQNSGLPFSTDEHVVQM